jgi:hypothetical protein
MNSLAEQIIVNILQSEMQLPTQSVWIRDQNRKFDDTGNLNIIVGMADSKPLGSETYMTTVGNNQFEVQELVTRENHQIDILSRDTSALMRRSEILLALKSFYSEQQQEANNFKIFNLPTNFLNTSDAEGGSFMNRFTITIACFVWYRKTKPLYLFNGDYYDEFSTRVDDEATIGTETPFIEFYIPPSEGIQ